LNFQLLDQIHQNFFSFVAFFASPQNLLSDELIIFLLIELLRKNSFSFVVIIILQPPFLLLIFIPDA